MDTMWMPAATAPSTTASSQHATANLIPSDPTYIPCVQGKACCIVHLSPLSGNSDWATWLGVLVSRQLRRGLINFWNQSLVLGLATGERGFRVPRLIICVRSGFPCLCLRLISFRHVSCMLTHCTPCIAYKI